VFLSKTWTFGERSFRLILKKDEWNSLLSCFEVPDGLSLSEAQAVRESVALADERRDFTDRSLFQQPPAWRVCRMRFRKDGLQLPLGVSRQQFDTPNPCVDL
jgi:hypothetical protein